MATRLQLVADMKTSAVRLWFVVGVALTLPVVAGCATRNAAVEGDSVYAAALTRDVAEAERKFPYGLAPMLYSPTIVPIAAPESAIQQR